jgi:hypothetical protein
VAFCAPRASAMAHVTLTNRISGWDTAVACVRTTRSTAGTNPTVQRRDWRVRRGRRERHLCRVRVWHREGRRRAQLLGSRRRRAGNAAGRCRFHAPQRGGKRGCALQADGTPRCWGQPVAADFLTRTYTSVSVGAEGACGIGTDQALYCVGLAAAPPAGSFKQVSVGGEIACGLRTDDTAACFASAGARPLVATPPAETFTAITTGLRHACGARPNGTVACRGDGGLGQTTVPPKFS